MRRRNVQTGLDSLFNGILKFILGLYFIKIEKYTSNTILQQWVWRAFLIIGLVQKCSRLFTFIKDCHAHLANEIESLKNTKNIYFGSVYFI